MRRREDGGSDAIFKKLLLDRKWNVLSGGSRLVEEWKVTQGAKNVERERKSQRESQRDREIRAGKQTEILAI